ncbi:MAG: SDR family oxidoreductase [SAR86 cluster bacterium]|nr:SDR family oxidoreductase [SAR86 cluster bacterium]
MYKDNLLKGKRILITGGGTGLGKEMARYLLKYGAEVIICGRREEILENTSKELMEETGGIVKFYGLDIRGAQDVDDVINNIFEEAPLDGLINNAAGNFISRTEDLSHRGFDAIASIVFHGTFYVTHSVGKRWLELNRPGSIISILATWVWTGSAYVTPSTMSKTAVHGMTKSLAVEWGSRGIRVNAIAPGPFPTEGAWARLSPDTGDGNSGLGETNNSLPGNPMDRVGEMEELGNLATFLMSDGCDYLTGQTIAIDGGQYLTGGTFSHLSSLKDEDWEAIKGNIKATNEKDKAKRSV